MIMKAGGEVPRSEVHPKDHKIGLRLTRRNRAISSLVELRRSISDLETSKLLGSRPLSTATRSAFGARKFQPHVTILQPNNGSPYDLKPIGKDLRNTIRNIEFDAFEVKYKPGN